MIYTLVGPAHERARKPVVHVRRWHGLPQTVPPGLPRPRIPGRHVWDTLVNRKEPVVIVGLKTETIIVPRPRMLLDRVRETVPVAITVQVESGAPSCSVGTTLGRKPVTEMRSAQTAIAA